MYTEVLRNNTSKYSEISSIFILFFLAFIYHIAILYTRNTLINSNDAILEMLPGV